MSLFEEQIKERKSADQRILENSFDEIAGVVLGTRRVFKQEDERTVAKNAIDEILLHFEMKPLDIPENFVSTEEMAEYCQQAYSLMFRDVELKESWYRDAFGPMLAFTEEGGVPVALLPGKLGGYVFTDPETKRRVKVNRKNAARFEAKALSFFRPFPQKALEPMDLIRYIRSVIPLSEWIVNILLQGNILVIGLMLPYITKVMTGAVLSTGRPDLLIGVSVSMLCILIASHLFGVAKGLFSKKKELKTENAVRAAVMMRLLSLPTRFFGRFGAGELKVRMDAIVRFSKEYVSFAAMTALTLATSVLYLYEIWRYAPGLLPVAIIYLLLMLVVSLITVRTRRKFHEKSLEVDAEESGFSYSAITGVRKIRLVGAEKRMFARWMKLYAEKAGLTYRPPILVRINSAIFMGIGLLSTILTYWLALKNHIDASSYFAFSAAFGAIVGMTSSAYGVTFSAHEIRPLLKIAEPILRTVPEETQEQEIVTKLNGGIELNHVSFRYDKESPYIFRDLSLKIKPKEYVAIVGKSGCGKSTLMRLLLGFEQPETGTIFYDGKNLSKLNLSSLHKKIGTVLQQSELFPGDIYTNIAVMTPGLSMEDAWDAAEKAGVADDIREMPMGMRTFVSEGSGTLSGGQKQRILLARAIAAKPKLLLLDEATSALDNITQKKVTDALDALNCTRIVIAHRVSTIRNCSRIIVIDGGNIVEEGTYEELLNRNGFFAGMVGRQLT